MPDLPTISLRDSPDIENQRPCIDQAVSEDQLAPSNHPSHGDQLLKVHNGKTQRPPTNSIPISRQPQLGGQPPAGAQFDHPASALSSSSTLREKESGSESESEPEPEIATQTQNQTQTPNQPQIQNQSHWYRLPIELRLAIINRCASESLYWELYLPHNKAKVASVGLRCSRNYVMDYVRVDPEWCREILKTRRRYFRVSNHTGRSPPLAADINLNIDTIIVSLEVIGLRATIEDWEKIQSLCIVSQPDPYGLKPLGRPVIPRLLSMQNMKIPLMLQFDGTRTYICSRRVVGIKERSSVNNKEREFIESKLYPRVSQPWIENTRYVHVQRSRDIKKRLDSTVTRASISIRRSFRGVCDKLHLT